MVNPAQIRAFAKALGKRAKTDPINAAVIVHFAEATGLEPRPLRDEAAQRRAWPRATGAGDFPSDSGGGGPQPS